MAERTALSKGPRPPKKNNEQAPRGRRTPEEVSSAMNNMAQAMALCGFAAGPNFQCPSCGTVKPKKVVLKRSKDTQGCYITCHACSWHQSAVKLVQEYLNLSYPQAIDVLNGVTDLNLSPERKGALERAAANAASHAIVDGFKAELSARTVALYGEVLSSPHSSLAIAQKYYGQWFISPAAVETLSFRYITNPDALAKDLLEKFGKEVVLASGIASEPSATNAGRPGELQWMFSKNYPVVEPQISPKGLCATMQFRPSQAQKKKIIAHKAGEGKYVPQFMSLRGATQNHLIGINLHHLCSAPPTRVDVVEGAKDVAADMTMGQQAFGLPGTSVLPPRQSIDALRRAGHTLRICMDGDAPGIAAQDKVLKHFIANGFPPERISKHSMPAGKDITDILVDHVKRAQQQ
jgi:hypothetical protein